MKISLYNITKQQIQIIKAFAIIAITFHNFLHETNLVGENEMELTPERIVGLFHFLRGNPYLSLDALFTYFGHYGVQLFIFCSGYGLSKLFIQNKPLSYREYIIPRLTKIYFLLLFGIIGCSYLAIKDWEWYLRFSILSLTMVKNFSNDYLFYGIGPWWYFSLAVQLYLLFPLLYRIIEKYKEKGFYFSLLASYLLIYVLSPVAQKINFPIYGNCIGHFPEFLAGMAFAYICRFHITLKIILVALSLFILSNFFEWAFPFGFLSVTIILVLAILASIRYLPEKIFQLFFFTGKISMCIFVTNGPVRGFTYHVFFKTFSLNPLLASLLHFGIVIIVSYIMYIVYNKFFGFFKKYIFNQQKTADK